MPNSVLFCFRATAFNTFELVLSLLHSGKRVVLALKLAALTLVDVLIDIGPAEQIHVNI